MPNYKKTTAHLKRGIIHDKVSPKDMRELNFTHNCEQCSYFNPPAQSCAFGHNTSYHIYENQMKSYQMSGTMALCRNHEID